MTRETPAKNVCADRQEKVLKQKAYFISLSFTAFTGKGVRFHDLRDGMVSSGSLEVGIAIRGPVNPRHQAGTFFKKKRQK